jgi:hypothetical protein
MNKELLETSLFYSKGVLRALQVTKTDVVLENHIKALEAAIA